jgi:hypothetical protein
MAAHPAPPAQPSSAAPTAAAAAAAAAADAAAAAAAAMAVAMSAVSSWSWASPAHRPAHGLRLPGVNQGWGREKATLAGAMGSLLAEDRSHAVCGAGRA